MDTRLFGDPALPDVELDLPTQFTSVERLVHQHHNIGCLLRFVEQEADTIARGETPDYPVVLAALHYLTEYIDRFHHPTEDAAFTLVRRRSPLAYDVVVPLALEHDDLTFQGRQLRALLQEAMDDHVVRRELAERACRDYVGALRRHMELEERHAFPLLERHVSSRDWRNIDQVLATQPDPLFGPIVEERYRELFRQLGTTAGTTCDYE